MSAETTTLVEFLLARIAEDEAVAAEQDGAEYFTDGAWPEGMPARVLAECAAKRAIIGMSIQATRESYVNAAAYLADALQALATVYADHPDYREEWSA